MGDRLVKIRKKVLSLIEEYKINEIAFEDIQL
nr:MAG TPA: crossover junction endodeoxyribonuclease [Caudoviricetes sp.]